MEINVLDQLKQQAEEQMKQSSTKYYNPLTRITVKCKEQLVFSVLAQGKSIRKGAKELKLNYSTAQYIIAQYKKKNTIKKDEIQEQTTQQNLNKISSYKPLIAQHKNKMIDMNNIEIQSTVGMGISLVNGQQI